MGFNSPDVPEAIEILSISSHGFKSNGDYVITALTGKSGLHLRPSMALFGIIYDFGDFNVILREDETGVESQITSAIDIISLGYREDREFQIVLRGNFMDQEKIDDFVERVKSLEKPEVAGCESVPNALKRILKT